MERSKKLLAPDQPLAPLEASMLGLSTVVGLSVAYPHLHSPMEGFFPPPF